MGKFKTFDVTARDAADRLGVHQETIKRWARDGRVPARKNMSGTWVFNADDLDRLPGRVVVEQVA